MRAFVVDNLFPKPVKTYGKGRKCETCGQPLSTYNRGPFCNLCTPSADNMVYNGIQFAVCECGEVYQVRKHGVTRTACGLCTVPQRPESPVEEKYCPSCGQTKKAAEFGRDKRRCDGLQSYCRECERERSRERYARRKAKAIS